MLVETSQSCPHAEWGWIGAAVSARAWPGDLAGWQELLARARQLDGRQLGTLFEPEAARRGAVWLKSLTDELWAGEPEPVAIPAAEIAE